MREGVSDVLGRSTTRKALWRIVPLIALCYLFAYIDRVNVGFAAVQMNVDLGFSATIYGLGAGLFFLGYALLEIPSNVLAIRFGPRRWIARIMITWGVLSTGTMFIHTPLQFYVMRFLLGAAEAGFYPALIYFFATWFPANYRGRAISRFYVASPLASLVMGAISGSLLGLDGAAGLRGWQWLFLVQGLPSVIMGLVVLRLLPETARTASWLTDDEKAWLQDELAREAASIGEPGSRAVLASLRDPKVLLLCATGFCSSGVMTTLSLSAPLVLLASTRLDTAQMGFLVGVGGLLGALAMLAAGEYADRRGDRFLNAFWVLLVMAGALLMMAIAPSQATVIVAYLGFAATCFTASMLLSSGWADVLHVRELAVGAAAINSVCNLGGFVMPFAWGAARDATGRFTIGLVALAIFSAVAATLTMRVRAGVRRSRRDATVVPLASGISR